MQGWAWVWTGGQLMLLAAAAPRSAQRARHCQLAFQLIGCRLCASPAFHLLATIRPFPANPAAQHLPSAAFCPSREAAAMKIACIGALGLGYMEQ